MGLITSPPSYQQSTVSLGYFLSFLAASLILETSFVKTNKQNTKPNKTKN